MNGQHLLVGLYGKRFNAPHTLVQEHISTQSILGEYHKHVHESLIAVNGSVVLAVQLLGMETDPHSWKLVMAQGIDQ